MWWDPFRPWPAGRHWVWLFLAIFVGLFQGSKFIGYLRPAPGTGNDFFQEWSSARSLLDGDSIYLEQTVVIERYLGFINPQVFVEVNAHPPTSVLVAIPLAYLNYPNANLVWNLLALAALGVTLWLLGLCLGAPLRLVSIFPAVTILLLCSPLRQQVMLGQWNLFLLLLLTGAWAAERAGRLQTAGALVGLAAALKLFPGFLFLYLALRREWRASAVGILTLILLTLVTASLVGPESYITYFRDVLPRVDRSQSGWNNASLIGFWRKLFDPATELEYIEPLWRSPLLARIGAMISCLAVVLTLAKAVLRARTVCERDRAFGLTITGMLLVSPLAWDHYFLLLILPVTVLAFHMPESPMMRASFLFLLGVLFLIEPQQLYERFLPEGRTVAATPLQTVCVLSLQCYALLGLFIVGAWRIREPAKNGDTQRAG